MSNKTYPLDDIQVLSSLEAVRKRPSFYYDLADPMLGSKIILTPLAWALEAKVEAHVSIISPERATLSWKKALPTESRGSMPWRQAEALVSQLFAGAPSAGLFDAVCPQLVVVNAACHMFDLIINDQHGEWGQRFFKGKAETPFELIGDSKGDHTFIETWLDTELLQGATIDERFVQSWCGDRQIQVL